ncbi:MAG: ABC transporter ATP-binding protein [Candidatus Omnitrophota bacterium]
MAILRAEGLIKRFPNGFRLNIDLQFYRGRAYGLLGANGAGKTTSLLLLSLLDIPEDGKLYFRKNRVTSGNRGFFRRKMVMSMEEPYFFRGSVWSNMAYGLKLRGIGLIERRRIIETALRRLKLERLATEDVRCLSQGQRRRLDIARALSIMPEVIFLDEPFAHIDEESKKIIREIIKETTERKATTIIFATHNVDIALIIADGIIYLEQGRIIENAQGNRRIKYSL